MQKLYFFILFIFCSVSVFTQNAVKADGLFQEANYLDAQKEYGLLLQRYPTSALYLYRYARCAQELGEYQIAIQYFEKSGNRYDLKHYNLGEIYMSLGYPEKAIMAYEAYLKTLKYTPDREKYVRAQIRQAEKIQRYMRRVEKVQIIDSVDIPLDSLLTVYQLSAEAGSLTIGDRNQFVYTNQRGDRRMWATRQDSIFAIVSSNKLMETWTTPDTLPKEVNMSNVQNYPYMLSDGVTLYFASKDTNGLGGYDIYVTRYNTHTNTYTTPENLGFPYNSSANDYLMVIDELQQVGYFATDRFSEGGYVRVYSFAVVPQKSYWRGLPIDSLVSYAQLRYALTANNISIGRRLVVDVDTMIPKNRTDVFFVLNDSVVYTSLQEFKNPISRKTYQEWVAADTQSKQNKIELDNLRLQYSTADEEMRKKMTPLILELENKWSQSIVQCEKLLHIVRSTELQVYQQ